MTYDFRITRLVHEGRGLVTQYDENGDRVMGWPEVAYEAARGICHLTSSAEPIPAPTVYRVIAEMKLVGDLFAQSLDQIEDGFGRSYEVGTPVESVPGRTPEDTSRDLHEALERARAAARKYSEAMQAAHSAVAGQGYREDEPATL